MAELEKDQLAKQVADLRTAFDLALSDKRKYPLYEFNAFVRSARNQVSVILLAMIPALMVTNLPVSKLCWQESVQP